MTIDPVGPATVALASADPLLVDRLRTTLPAPLAVVGQAADAAAAVAVARRTRPGLVLLDARLPGGAADATRELVDRALGRVVVLSSGDVPDTSVMLAVLRAGACGWLPARTAPARLGSALLGVLRGEAALTRVDTGVLLARYQTDRGRSVAFRGRTVHLTPRELEILQLLRSGHSSSSIAHRLGIAPTTVRTHVAGLQRKFRVSGRSSLVAALTE